MGQCLPNSTAQIDDTEIECTETISFACLFHAGALPFLELPANATGTQIVAALVSSLTNAHLRIGQLEAQNTGFESRIATLEA